MSPPNEGLPSPKQAKDTELIDHATDIRLRAEIRAGELLAETEKAKGTRGQLRGKKKGTSKGKGKGKGSSGGSTERPPEEVPTYKDLGITFTQSLAAGSASRPCRTHGGRRRSSNM